MQKYFVSSDGAYLGSFDGPDDQIPDYLLCGLNVGTPPGDARQVWKDGGWLPLDLPFEYLPVTRRQLRLTLVREGISLAAIGGLIAAMPEGLQKDEAEIEWADAKEFERDHPTLLLIAQALNLTPTKVDEMWIKAMMA